MKLQRRCCFIVGPTASGKSALAARLAAELGSVVINADAYQVYRGLEVVSAAPDETETSQAPHHLFSIIEPSAAWDAHQHRLAALELLQEADAPPAIITGGSGLYLKFLSHGPSELPAADPQLRAELDQLPIETLLLRLEKLDPVAAGTTDPQNRRYLTRNLEICLLSGRRVSELNESQWRPPLQAGVCGFALQWERGVLVERIAQRTRQMLEQGAIEEVAQLKHPSSTAAKAIGIPQIQRYLRGESDLATCEEDINIATRQYAKRQRTWFKRESDWLQALEVSESDSVHALAAHILKTL